MTANPVAGNVFDSSGSRAEASGTRSSGDLDRPARQGSVTQDMADLRALDASIRDRAAWRIWERFAPRLCALARSRLNDRVRVREDENDIVQSLFQSFFAAQQGPGLALGGRKELWRLLVWMTLCKVANAANHHQRDRRDVRRERSPASPIGPSDGGEDRFAEVEDTRMLSPDDVVISRAELARILSYLPEDLRQILTWRLEGYTNADISRMIARTKRMVEIKMQLIREILDRDPLIHQERDTIRGPGAAPDR
jgi:DNA-directed RNA polymerase specialized sigma24 family protein